MGHKAGDRVHVKLNEHAGYDVVIRSIENTGEEATDEHAGNSEPSADGLLTKSGKT